VPLNYLNYLRLIYFPLPSFYRFPCTKLKLQRYLKSVNWLATLFVVYQLMIEINLLLYLTITLTYSFKFNLLTQLKNHTVAHQMYLRRVTEGVSRGSGRRGGLLHWHRSRCILILKVVSHYVRSESTPIK
jgi:hypothetical protein